MSQFYIKHTLSCVDGPTDGVSAETEGVYTKFKRKGVFQKEKKIIRQAKTKVDIKASVTLGVVSIHDLNRDHAIAVPIMQMAAIVNEALRVGMIGTEEEQDKEKTIQLPVPW